MLKAELEVEVERLRAEVKQQEADFDALRRNLLNYAGAAAYEHELCGVLEATLEKVGLTVPDVTVKVIESVERTYRVPLIEAHRLGLYDEHADRSEQVEDAIKWGNLNDYAVSDERVATTVEIAE